MSAAPVGALVARSPRRLQAAAEWNVLVVDDDHALLELLGEALERWGCRPILASGGPQALRRVLEGPVDLVLTDLVMKPQSGLELMRRLREIRPGMPLAVITGHASLDSARRAMRLGARDFLVKPFRLEEVFDLIEMVAGESTDPVSRRASAAEPAPEPSEEDRPWLPSFGDGFSMDHEMAEFERSLIRAALGRTDGVKTHAARLLGIKRTTLIEKMKRLGLPLASRGESPQTQP